MEQELIKVVTKVCAHFGHIANLKNCKVCEAGRKIEEKKKECSTCKAFKIGQ